MVLWDPESPESGTAPGGLRVCGDTRHRCWRLVRTIPSMCRSDIVVRRTARETGGNAARHAVSRPNAWFAEAGAMASGPPRKDLSDGPAWPAVAIPEKSLD